MNEQEEKEYVYIPKSIAILVKEMESDKGKEEIIRKYVEDSKIEIKANLENLDNDVVVYKGLMLKAKNAFEEAKNEQLSASYALWEKFEKELPSTREKIGKLTDLINPLRREIEEVDKLLKSVSTYEVKQFLEVIKEVDQYISCNGETGKILKFLFDNYKKKE